MLCEYLVKKFPESRSHVAVALPAVMPFIARFESIWLKSFPNLATALPRALKYLVKEFPKSRAHVALATARGRAFGLACIARLPGRFSLRLFIFFCPGFCF